MQFIQRASFQFRSPAARMRRLKQATLYLMKHVGMTGRCDCQQLRDADGRASWLMLIQTNQIVPVADREVLQAWLRRKLGELGESDGLPVLLLIRDGEELRQAARTRVDASSARVASIIAAANQETMGDMSGERLAEARDAVRERRMSARRGAREGSDYTPLDDAPLTDIGAFPDE